MRSIVISILAVLSLHASGQEIAGAVTDEHNQPLISATVWVKQGGVLKGDAYTDYDGNYIIKQIDPGYYDVIAFFTGYDTVTISKAVVIPGGRTMANIKLTRISGEPKYTIKAFKIKLVDKEPIECYRTERPETVASRRHILHCYTDNINSIDNFELRQVAVPIFTPKTGTIDFRVNTPTSFTLNREELTAMPATNIAGIIALLPMVY